MWSQRRRHPTFVRAALLAGLALCVTLAPLAAMSAPKRQSVRGKNNVTVDQFDAQGNSGTELTAINIEGRVFKPTVFMVIARSDFRYTGLKFKQSFLDRIVLGALKKPF